MHESFLKRRRTGGAGDPHPRALGRPGLAPRWRSPACSPRWASRCSVVELLRAPPRRARSRAAHRRERRCSRRSACSAAVLRPVAIVSKGSLVGPQGRRARRRVAIHRPARRSTARGARALERALAELDKRIGRGAALALQLRHGPGRARRTRRRRARRRSRGCRPRKPSVPGQAGARLRPRRRAGVDRPRRRRAARGHRGALRRAPRSARRDRARRRDARGAGAALGARAHRRARRRARPRDASIRKVLAAGAAVAHQPFSLRIEIGCDGGLACGDIPVVARELRDQGPPVTLAEGVAHVVSGKATIELSMTIERAGARILEISIQPPEGDTIPENDRRFVSDRRHPRSRARAPRRRPPHVRRARAAHVAEERRLGRRGGLLHPAHAREPGAGQRRRAGAHPLPRRRALHRAAPHLRRRRPAGLQRGALRPHASTSATSRGTWRTAAGSSWWAGQGSFVGGHYAGTALARGAPGRARPQRARLAGRPRLVRASAHRRRPQRAGARARSARCSATSCPTCRGPTSSATPGPAPRC